MSNDLTPKAYLTRLGNPSAKAVLCFLADAVNDDGYGWPGEKRILWSTELKKRTLQRAIEVMQAIGLVRKIKVTGELYKVAYQLNLQMLGRDLAAEFGAAFLAAQKKSVSETCNEAADEACDEAMESVSETQKDVSETRKSVSETQPPHPLSGGTTMEPPWNLLPDSAETVQPPSAADGDGPSPQQRKATATAKAKAPGQGKGKNKGKNKPPPDPRHVPFKLAVMKYANFKSVLFVWDGSEARALTNLLRSAPELTLERFQACLNHRAKSAGVAHGERPRMWLPRVLRYQQGPLNEFGRTQIPAAREAAVGMAAVPAEFDETAALSYWEALRARGSATYAKDAPAWVRARLDVHPD